MTPGYYRYPTNYNDIVVFSAEDDLWETSASGGLARRITSGLGEASRPLFSPDGKWITFLGRQEGVAEIFVMESHGSPARRLTYLAGSGCLPCAWTPDGRIVFASNARQPFQSVFMLYSVDPRGGPLEQLACGPARSAAFGPNGGQVIGRHTGSVRWKRYRGGTVGRLWIDPHGSGQYHPLIELPGNLASPLWLPDPADQAAPGRIYFTSDHEGHGNLYSCRPDGSDLRRHTDHEDFYVRNPTSDGQRIVYSLGADLYRFNPLDDRSQPIEIDLRSPRTQRARRFNGAGRYVEDWDLHPTGQIISLTARGHTFAFFNWEGPVAELLTEQPQAESFPDQETPRTGVRTRLPRWLHEGRRIVAVTDEGGEEAFVAWEPANDDPPVRLDGPDIGRPEEVLPNPVKDVIAFSNHRYELAVLNLDSRQLTPVDRGQARPIEGFAWSPDGEWLAYSVSISLQVSALKLWKASTGETFTLTRPVLRDVAPAWDPKGRFLYFLSYRTFDPIFDNLHFDLGFPRGERPYLIPLQADQLSPFIPRPQLDRPNGRDEDSEDDERKNGNSRKNGEGEPKADEEKPASKTDERKTPPAIRIDLDGIHNRVLAFPVSDGRYGRILGTRDGRVIYSRLPGDNPLSPPPGSGPPEFGAAIFIYHFETLKEDQLISGVIDFSLNLSASHLAYRSMGRLRVVRAGDKSPSDTEGANRRSGWIDLNRAKIEIHPGAEWRQMFREAWRLQRDQFWTPDMSQVDWLEVHDRYLPLVDRVASRGEFSDLMWEMQGELGTSHAYEMGGDYRPEPHLSLGSLGADFVWDDSMGGWRILHIARGDSWEPRLNSPLAAPGLDVQPGDGLISVNGRRLTRLFSPEIALVNLAGEEVALTFAPRPALPETEGGNGDLDTSSTEKDILAEGSSSLSEKGSQGSSESEPSLTPSESEEPNVDAAVETNPSAEAPAPLSGKEGEGSGKPEPRTIIVRTLYDETGLRYREWVERNRRYVYEKTNGRVGYIHIPDMGSRGYAEFHRAYLTELERDGLIVDVRFNTGGQVSPLILEKLARRRIGYEKSRWSQVAGPYPPESASGPMVALTNENAGSDGDIFSHGFKLMKLGPLIGQRTWGGVIGISPRHRLVDGTLTTQPEYSSWFNDIGLGLENHGAEPDIEVVDLPQDYPAGLDRQLDRAIEEVLQLMQANPPALPDFETRPNLAAPRLPPR
jgi:tricorn protease